MSNSSPGYATSADGTRIAYETAGSRPPVMIVSGAFGTRTDARKPAGALAGKFTAVSYAPRGLGDSGDSPATLRNVVSSLEEILPNATKRTLPGQGHGAPAGVLAPILASFYGG